MEVEFLGQPFNEQGRLGPMLRQALLDADAFWVIAAWAQLTGLEPLEGSLRKLVEDGGSALAVLGIDGGIATREGLEKATELFDPVYVFHDSGSRTFHPKVYCVEAASGVLLAAGSSNLTGGGLFRNYEANLVLRLNLEEDDDRAIYEAAVAFRDSLLVPGLPFAVLDDDLIERMAGEEALLTSKKEREESERATEAKADSLAREIFGGPVTGLPSTPRGSGRATSQTNGARDDAEASAATVEESWVKELRPSDVLRKPESSHQRNYVILGQAGHPIDQKTWFREVLFGLAPWTEQPKRGGAGTKEVAEVTFQSFIDEDFIGEYELWIDHSPSRIADQNNSPTYLNWSGLLEVIKAQNFQGWWLELARLVDGTFRLRLLREDPRP